MPYKVEIIPKNESFLDDFFLFLIEKSDIFRRDISIDNILNDEVSVTKNIDYISVKFLGRKQNPNLKSIPVIKSGGFTITQNNSL